MTEPAAIPGSARWQKDDVHRVSECSPQLQRTATAPVHAAHARIVSLDVLRGLMALSVTLYHLSGWTHVFGRGTRTTSAIAALGIYSVEGFFIISGFCFFHLYGGTRFDLAATKRFHIKRFLRIAPLYYFVLAINLALGQAVWPGFSWGRIAENVTLTFGLFHPNHSMVLGGWSIGIEYVFYLLFPALAWLPRARACLYVLAFAVAAAAWPFTFYLVQAAPEPSKFHTYVRIPNHAFLFLLGAVASDLHRHVRTRINAALVAFVLLASFALLGLVLHTQPVLYDHFALLMGTTRILCLTLCFLAVLLFAFARTPHSRLLAPWAWLGDLSYAVYLLHPLAWLATSKLLTAEAPAHVAFALGLGLTIAFAALLHHGLERPAMALARRLTLP